MRELILQFVGDPQMELVESCFSHPRIGDERRCIRGKRSGAYRGYSTFQWTKGVQALSLLLIEAAIRGHIASSGPLLAGQTGSPASCLDYAIDKQTVWLMEMFGWTDSGDGFARRLFVRSNAGQRMPGPVAISLNHNYLASEDIKIFANYEAQVSLQQLSRLRESLRASVIDGMGKKYEQRPLAAAA